MEASNTKIEMEAPILIETSIFKSLAKIALVIVLLSSAITLTKKSLKKTSLIVIEEAASQNNSKQLAKAKRGRRKRSAP